jgi:hypothetical protein
MAILGCTKDDLVSFFYASPLLFGSESIRINNFFRSPGRWQVSYFMKLVSAYMAVKFEGKLDDSKPLNMFWRDASVPNPDAVLSVRPLAA